MKTVNDIPNYKDRVKKIALTQLPEISGYASMSYDGTPLPAALARKLVRRSYGKQSDAGDSLETMIGVVEQAIEEKNFVLHAEIIEDGQRYFALTSDEFSPIFPVDAAAAIKECTQIEPFVRVFYDKSIDFQVPISTKMEGLYARVSLGQYGMLGGNGESAVKYGVSLLSNGSHWTIFSPRQYGGQGRVIHRNKGEFSVSQLAHQMEMIQDFASDVEASVDASKSQGMSRDEVHAYFDLYKGKGLNSRVREEVMNRNPRNFNVYDLATDLTQICQDRSICTTTSASRRVEYLAGELILAYDKVKEAVGAHRAHA